VPAHGQVPTSHTSLGSALAIYAFGVGLSVAALGWLWQRFTWRVSHPQRANFETVPARAPTEPQPQPMRLVPSLQVVAFAGYLKGIPALATLVEPYGCEGVGKQPQRPRYCKYRAGDLEVQIGYDRDHGGLRSVGFVRRSLNDAPPLPWSDLAKVMPWVCPLVSAAQAADIAAQFAGQYPEKRWASRAGPTSQRPDDGGRRELRFDPHPQCHVVLVEQVDRDRTYPELFVLSINPRRNLR
jgi:hypothetical protein